MLGVAVIDVRMHRLSDGLPHDFTFSVFGQGDDGSINNNWCVALLDVYSLTTVSYSDPPHRFITGALHLVLDSSDPPVRTKGRLLSYDVSPTPLIISAGFPSAGGQLKTMVSAQRTLDIRAELETGAEGKKKEVRVSHLVDFGNEQFLADNGTYQVRSSVS